MIDEIRDDTPQTMRLISIHTKDGDFFVDDNVMFAIMKAVVDNYKEIIEVDIELVKLDDDRISVRADGLYGPLYSINFSGVFVLSEMKFTP